MPFAADFGCGSRQNPARRGSSQSADEDRKARRTWPDNRRPLQSMSKRATWRALQDHHVAVQGLNLKTLFANDSARGDWMIVEAAGIYFGSSENRVSDETLELLVGLAEQSGLRDRIDTTPLRYTVAAIST